MLDREGGPGRSSPADAADPGERPRGDGRSRRGLTPALGELLQLIAVSPRGIALPVLRAAALMDDEPLLGALDEGLHSGMLDEIRDANLVYRVRHELLRRTVYERLSSFRAAALHLRVGEALEAMPGGRRDRIINELAFHFRAAAPIAGNGRAVEYALEAAAQANAPSPSPRRQVDSRRRSPLASPTSPPRRTSAVGRGWRGISPAGPPRRWRASPQPRRRRASASTKRCKPARRSDLRRPAGARASTTRVPWPSCRRPPAGIAAEPSALKVRVLAHLSRALAYRGDHVAAGQCWSQAVAMARLVADRGALMVALVPRRMDARLASARRDPGRPHRSRSSWRACFPTTPCPTSPGACASRC